MDVNKKEIKINFGIVHLKLSAIDLETGDIEVEEGNIEARIHLGRNRESFIQIFIQFRV